MPKPKPKEKPEWRRLVDEVTPPKLARALVAVKSEVRLLRDELANVTGRMERTEAHARAAAEENAALKVKLREAREHLKLHDTVNGLLLQKNREQAVLISTPNANGESGFSRLVRMSGTRTGRWTGQWAPIEVAPDGGRWTESGYRPAIWPRIRTFIQRLVRW